MALVCYCPPASLFPANLSTMNGGFALFPRATTTRNYGPSNPNANLMFDQTHDRIAPDWEAQVRAAARGGRAHEGLALFREMVGNGQQKPTGVSLGAAIACCGSLRANRSGRELHAFVLRHSLAGLDSRCLESSLVRFYAHCGLISTARQVFNGMPLKDVVSWTVMLMAYANSKGYEDKVMILFQEMLISCVAPNQHTITVVLSSAMLGQGEQLHAYIIKMSWDSDAFVGSALVDMYAKNGFLDRAQLVFGRIENKDVACYNCLISHYGRVGGMEDLAHVFNEMCFFGLAPNQSTFVVLLSGCANFGLIGLSQQFHAQVVLGGFEDDGIVQGIIVDMYAKCGDLNLARKAFDRIPPKKSVVAWNSIIGGYGKHGCFKDALTVFSSMLSGLTPPDYITFICLLSVCSHSGLVDEGLRLFDLMINVYKIAAQNEHYCCIVDLLGRAGMVREAYEFISKNKLEFRASVWGALLSACRDRGDVEIGEVAARKLFELEPECSGSYVALASIYAATGRWDDAMAIRELMDDHGIKKDTGYSWIEIGGVVHKFRAREGIDHPGMEDIHFLCDGLNSCISGPSHLHNLFDI